MVADIASGNGDAAEILFLIAAIVAGLAALAPAAPDRFPARTGGLGWAAVCLLAIAWLIL